MIWFLLAIVSASAFGFVIGEDGSITSTEWVLIALAAAWSTCLAASNR